MMQVKKATLRTLLVFSVLFAELLLLPSCRKEEAPFDFPDVPYVPPPPPATGHDTVISVTALLNNDSFTALGRALTPSPEGLEFSFLTIEGNQLFIKLAADTPGTYEMKRSVSSHTAVWYVKMQTETRSFTSRATADAGGVFTVDSINPASHRIKGTFRLLLTSRSYPETYDFKEGVFDILYNFMEMTINGSKAVAAVQTPSNINQGTPIEPYLDNISFIFADNSAITISAGKYDGLREYPCTVVYRNAQEKTFTASNVKMKLIRYHYAEFIEAEFGPAELTSGDGSKVNLSDGRFVQGNTK